MSSSEKYDYNHYKYILFNLWNYYELKIKPNKLDEEVRTMIKCKENIEEFVNTNMTDATNTVKNDLVNSFDTIIRISHETYKPNPSILNDFKFDKAIITYKPEKIITKHINNLEYEIGRHQNNFYFETISGDKVFQLRKRIDGVWRVYYFDGNPAIKYLEIRIPINASMFAMRKKFIELYNDIGAKLIKGLPIDIYKILYKK